MRRPLSSLLLAAGLLAAGCGDDGGSDTPLERSPLVPSYDPETADDGGTRGRATGASGSTTVSTAGSGATGPGPTGGDAGDDAQELRARTTDPRGDATPSLEPTLERPPEWAELVAATLVRRATGFELRVRLGDEAPEGTGDDHTMNVATFFDVDGDGSIDYEVWANVAAEGWGGSWFDNDNGRARYLDESQVAISIEQDLLVLRFPLAHVGSSSRFRWSMASEWASTVFLGTPASSRDDMPDDDAPVQFPN